MTPALALAALLTAAPMVNLPTSFWQVTPRFQEGLVARDKDRAVLLVHGLVPRPVQPSKAAIPEPHSWQKPDSFLVKSLAADFDVYGFSYAQTVPVDGVCWSHGLRTAVHDLKEAGYKDIVVIGHSAGGVIVRQFAEQFPESGITKVIIVAAPHAGSPWALIPQFGLTPNQEPFIKSLAPAPRQQQCLKCKPIADGLEVCCVVCKLPRFAGDSIVPAASQWPEEFQKQGIPAALVPVNHFEAVRSPEGAAVIAELAREKLTRWTPEQVEQGRRTLMERKK
jgi:pimeloyl-ACP methyl ester carboxylesterase